MTEVEQIAELRAALETLVKLHKDWDKGTAYVPVKFMHDNNAAIAAARDVLRKTEHATPATATTAGAPCAGVSVTRPLKPAEREAVASFRKEMRDNAIPKAMQRMADNDKAVAEVRHVALLASGQSAQQEADRG